MANARASEAAKLPMLGAQMECSDSALSGSVRVHTVQVHTTGASHGASHRLARLLRQERKFLLLIGGMFLVAGLSAPTPPIAMWVGFLFASYSVIANDSIQTLGTFIASNKASRWWVLWLFVGGIFLFTTCWSWFKYGGDVSHQRLTSDGFATAPTSFGFLQIAAPVFLLILTRLKMPVSTTFLILSCFSTTSNGFTSMLEKSFFGYGVAFVVSIVLWLVAAKAMARWFQGSKPHPLWRPAQWLATGLLWSVWLMQDAANVAVFLPRQLSGGELLLFLSIIFLGLGLLFYLRGDRIQAVVEEKSEVVDVRPATIIGVVYALILFYFKEVSNVPMSTTWVFIGLLAGREIAMSLRKTSGRPLAQVARMAGRDLGYVCTGLAVSVLLAISINDNMRQELFALLGIG